MARLALAKQLTAVGTASERQGGTQNWQGRVHRLRSAVALHQAQWPAVRLKKVEATVDYRVCPRSASMRPSEARLDYISRAGATGA